MPADKCENKLDRSVDHETISIQSGIVRESGMPALDLWRSFFEPTALLEEIGFGGFERVLELGAGYGLFTLPLASLCSRLTAIEIDRNLCTELRSVLKSKQCDNVCVVDGDFTNAHLFDLRVSFDAVVLFNILHMENPMELLDRLRLVMATTCKCFVLHWRTDIPTPRGPSLAIRSTPEQCRAWFAECGFKCERELFPSSAPFHFAQVFSIAIEGV